MRTDPLYSGGRRFPVGGMAKRLLAVLGWVLITTSAAMQGSATFNGSRLAGALGILIFQAPSVVAENGGSPAVAGTEQVVARNEEKWEAMGIAGAGESERIPDDTLAGVCLLYTSPSPRDLSTSRMPSSA